MYACVLSNKPILLEPIFTVYIQTINSEIGTVYGCLNHRRGTVEQIETSETNPTVNIIGKIPVAESFGFDAFLKSETSGKALAQLVFDHWAKVPDVKYNDFICITRNRKNLSEEIPPLDRYEDKL
jgi:elongation factor 2